MIEALINSKISAQGYDNHHYNELGQYTGRTSDTGNTVTLNYNPIGQLSHLQLNQETPIQFEYDEMGRIKQEQLTENLTREINYNNQGQITSQNILKDTQPLFNTHYHYDKVGNLLHTKKTGQLVGGSDHIQKGTSYLEGLKNLAQGKGKYSTEVLSSSDRSLMSYMIGDLKDALNY